MGTGSNHEIPAGLLIDCKAISMLCRMCVCVGDSQIQYPPLYDHYEMGYVIDPVESNGRGVIFSNFEEIFFMPASYDRLSSTFQALLTSFVTEVTGDH